jgi:hypothetical protein
MAILRGLLGSKGTLFRVLGLSPQKEMPIIRRWPVPASGAMTQGSRSLTEPRGRVGDEDGRPERWRVVRPVERQRIPGLHRLLLWDL